MPPRKDSWSHQRAFNIYDETRNFREVERQLIREDKEVNYVTILNWASKGFKCHFGCPYHDYESLLEEKAKALRAAVMVMDKTGDPTKAELAIDQSLDAAPLAINTFPVIKSAMRSDIERIQDLEYLYAKIYFHATGIGKQYDDIVKDQETLKSLFRNGLQLKSLESAISALTTVMNEIETVKERAGLSKPTTITSKPIGQVTLDSLRKMKELIDNTPAEKVRDLLALQRMEEAKPIEGVVIEQRRTTKPNKPTDS